MQEERGVTSAGRAQEAGRLTATGTGGGGGAIIACGAWGRGWRRAVVKG